MTSRDALRLRIPTISHLPCLLLTPPWTEAIAPGPFPMQATALLPPLDVPAWKTWPKLTSLITVTSPWHLHRAPITHRCRRMLPAKTSIRISMLPRSHLHLSCSRPKIPTRTSRNLRPSHLMETTKTNLECTWDSRTVICSTIRVTSSLTMSNLLRLALNLLLNILTPLMITAGHLLRNQTRNSLLLTKCSRLTVQWNNTIGRHNQRILCRPCHSFHP